MFTGVLKISTIGTLRSRNSETFKFSSAGISEVSDSEILSFQVFFLDSEFLIFWDSQNWMNSVILRFGDSQFILFRDSKISDILNRAHLQFFEIQTFLIFKFLTSSPLVLCIIKTTAILHFFFYAFSL